jgi:hypothetical protein
MKDFFLQLTSPTISMFSVFSSPDIVQESVVGIGIRISSSERVGRFLITLKKKRNIIVIVIRIAEMFPKFAKVPLIQNGIISSLIPFVILKDLSATRLSLDFFIDKFTIFVRCPLKNSGIYCRRLLFSRKPERTLLWCLILL